MTRLNKELADLVTAADALAEEYLLRALWWDRNHEQADRDDPACVAEYLAVHHLNDRTLASQAQRLATQLTTTLTERDDQRTLSTLREVAAHRRTAYADAGFAFGLAVGRRLSGGVR